MAKFSRSSTAYKQDGSVVNANVPRFERVGKNLLNITSVTKINALSSATYANGMVTLVAGSTGVSGYAQTQYFALKANTTYTVSFVFDKKTTNRTGQVLWFNSPGGVISTNKTFTPSSDMSVTLGFYVASIGNIGDTVSYSNIQIEIGSTATDYEPYQQGVMVEEGTANLALNPLFTTTAGWKYNSNGTGGSFTVNANWGKLVKGSSGTYTLLRQAQNITINQNDIYSHQMTFKNNVVGDVGIRLGYLNYGGETMLNFALDGTGGTITKTITRTMTSVNGATQIYIDVILGTTYGQTNPASQVEFSFTMLEKKPYATSFHPTTRNAESIAVPASAIPVSEGTIEFDVVFNSYLLTVSGNKRLFDCYGTVNGASDQYCLHCYYSNGNFVFYHNFGSVGNLQYVLKSYTPTNGEKVRIALSWENGELAIAIQGLIQKATGILTVINSIASAYIGGRAGVVPQANSLFSNLRISNKARSDAELANTGALAVDEWTTYFLPMNGNLSATCHPVMLVQGSGQVLLSRVGRGTRSIKVQGSGQVKLKRSAQYYPTIAVGTKGEVQLSRNGIGYRSMKVEGQGSFKIQEPNIEIYPEIREREATTNIIERESTTEVIGVPYAGDTIKIKGTFKSFEGVAADPTSITLKIYDTINNLLTTINVTSANRVSAGIYEVNYTIPDGYQALYYEWHCVQGDSPQVTMGKIIVLKRGQV